MSCKSNQKKRVQGKNEPILRGLAGDVGKILSGLYDIQGVICGPVRKYHGTPKVRVPVKWPQPRLLPVTVCDTDFGERDLLVAALKAGAIARILRTRLADMGVRVC